MSDEGAAFPIVSSELGYHHVLDRKHFTQQIVTSWHEIPDNKKDAYHNSIHTILNSTSETSYQEQMQIARSQFNCPKSLAFLDKIHQHRHKVVGRIPAAYSQWVKYQISVQNQQTHV
jgi:hypothetical protein